MKKEETTTCRVDDHLSPANKIPDPHQIVQHDVINAHFTLQEECMREHAKPPVSPFVGGDTNWERTYEAQSTIRRALHHQPGEAGSSTWKPGSRRPGTIVRRP